MRKDATECRNQNLTMLVSCTIYVLKLELVNEMKVSKKLGNLIQEKEDVMVRFYDPKDDNDLARVEALLIKGSIEYFLVDPPAGAGTVHW